MLIDIFLSDCVVSFDEDWLRGISGVMSDYYKEYSSSQTIVLKLISDHDFRLLTKYLQYLTLPDTTEDIIRLLFTANYLQLSGRHRELLEKDVKKYLEMQQGHQLIHLEVPDLLKKLEDRTYLTDNERHLLKEPTSFVGRHYKRDLYKLK